MGCHMNVNSIPISIQDKTTTNKKEPPAGKLKISATVRKMRRPLRHDVKLESLAASGCKSRGLPTLFTFPFDYNLSGIPLTTPPLVFLINISGLFYVENTI